MEPEHIVIAGKSGVGTTTTAVNLSAALVERGLRVAHVGYDHKRNSTALLRGEKPLLPLCGADCGRVTPACSIGFAGILCIEGGGGGDEENSAEFGKICRLEAIARFKPDFVVHDISGEPDGVIPFISGDGDVWRLFVVTTSDTSAINTLNSYIGVLAERHEPNGYFGGVVANNLAGPFFESLVADFVDEIGANLAANVPRSLIVSASEYTNKSIIETAPYSHISYVYRRMARFVADRQDARIPHFLNEEELAHWSRKWGEILTELETGMVRDGAAI